MRDKKNERTILVHTNLKPDIFAKQIYFPLDLNSEQTIETFDRLWALLGADLKERIQKTEDSKWLERL